MSDPQIQQPAGNVTNLFPGASASPSGQASQTSSSLGDGGGGSHIPDMRLLLGKLEGEINGLKHGQTLHLAALGGSFALMLGALAIIAALLFVLMAKVDQQGDEIVRLPSKVGAELRDITKTLAESITAAKQTPPQVILMPAPQLPPTQPPTLQRQP